MILDLADFPVGSDGKAYASGEPEYVLTAIDDGDTEDFTRLIVLDTSGAQTRVVLMHSDDVSVCRFPEIDGSSAESILAGVVDAIPAPR